MQIDFLVVGQGLAGSLLAFELMERGCKVIIIDNGQESASQISAGLINPLSGPRLAKTKDIDILLAHAKQCYARFSVLFQQPFYVEKPMLRIFRNGAERQYAQKRCSTPDYQAYLDKVIDENTMDDSIIMPFGYLKQKQTGYLLTQPLLACLKDFFIARHSYRCMEFSYQDIQFSPCLSWNGICPKTIIFCEGYRAQHNPWFSWLPFQLAKGEILTLQLQAKVADKLLNYGHWLIPMSQQQIRIGATFDRDNINLTPTQAAKDCLLNEIGGLSSYLEHARLIYHAAHIRPCTLDKQPFIGYHPRHQQLAIFNGFGAKGSLTSPYYSHCFVDSLLNNTPPPCPINRYYETHFTG